MEQCGFLQGALGSSLASSFLKSCKFSFQPIKHGLFSSLSLKVITIPFLLFSKTNKQRHFSKKGQSTNSLVETLNIYIYTPYGITSIYWHASIWKPDSACPIFSYSTGMPLRTYMYLHWWDNSTYVYQTPRSETQFLLCIEGILLRLAVFFNIIMALKYLDYIFGFKLATVSFMISSHEIISRKLFNCFMDNLFLITFFFI